MKRMLVLFVVLLGVACTNGVQAQWHVGALYIAREGGAQNGGGFLLERTFDAAEGEMQLGLRTQASYAVGVGSPDRWPYRYRSGLFDVSLTGLTRYHFLQPYTALGLGLEAYWVRAHPQRSALFGIPEDSDFRSAKGYGLMQVGTAFLPERRFSPYVGVQVRRLFSGYKGGYELPEGLLQGELVLGLSVSL